MASVTSTYARAFADVVFDQHLDPAQDAGRRRSRWPHWRPRAVDLREVWEAPSIPAEQKRALLDAIVARDGISRPGAQLCRRADRSPAHQVSDPIVKEFEQELNRRHGIRRSTDHQCARAGRRRNGARSKRRSKRLTGKKVRARYAQDGSILGGAMVKSAARSTMVR